MKASLFKPSKFSWFSIAITALVAFFIVAGGARAADDKKDNAATTPPKVGDTAPDFRLPYATQEAIHLKPEEQMALSSLRGKNVILAFYPADWSGGCTKEVCTLRDTFAELSKLNATVLGVSGDYVSTELFQRLGIADQVISKSRRIEGGERVGAVVARGEAEIGFQQLSELLPVPGIDHVTPLPPEVQKVSVFSAGVALSTKDSDAAHALIRFLASPEAARAITNSGLEPIGNR